MTDDCVILTPIDTINTFESIATYARARFNTVANRYGGVYTRQRNTETKNSLGDITAITSNYISIKLMFYDRFKSNVLIQPGISSNSESISSQKSNVRAYVSCDTDILQGDFILVNYDSLDGSYDEKYRVIEKETHELADSPIFYTLYLIKEAI